MIPHGTTTGYNYYACRCDDCKESVRRYMQKYRAARGGPTKGETRAWRAADLATKRLRAKYPRQYARLVEEAKKELLAQDRELPAKTRRRAA